jgi:type IV pilus assembly protein PilA
MRNLNFYHKSTTVCIVINLMLEKIMLVMNNKNAKGFSLVETMIVLGIVGLTTAIALPIYTNYTKTAKVTESMKFLAIGKTQIVSEINKLGITNGTSGVEITGLDTILGDQEGTYGDLTINSSGVLLYTFGANSGELGGNTITLVPTMNNNKISWACTFTGSFPKDPCTN